MIVMTQVCATYYDQHKVTAEIKTVQAVFEMSCKDEQVRWHLKCQNNNPMILKICEPAPAYSPAYSHPPACHARHVCYKTPALLPIVKKVQTFVFASSLSRCTFWCSG